ncbi:DMT family transporter [Wenxinia marina]|uniref:Transporter family-2 protein n=1 Tax=Wenxinia marina DSM 24838 TaxID=1123501 RepID=A0A0D0QBX6_9RHOB|nr:DMT family transporter [Wenxinia marina]KIQ68458.1 hypothetical protein Wenmar_02728 [Wenxinia marina DSM 24838]GGL65949.1 membrane protein [Wenxinia marina]
MAPSPLTAAALMFAAGLGIPVLAAINAALGRTLGAPAAAAAVLFVVAFAAALAVMLLTAPGARAGLAAAPRWQLTGGLFVAFYVLSVTWVAPSFGVGNAVFFVLLGQLVSAALIDQFGLFTATAQPLTWMRGLGLGVMGLGVVITQLAAR